MKKLLIALFAIFSFCIVNAQTVTKFLIADMKPTKINNVGTVCFNTIAIDNKNNIWCGNNSAGILQYNGIEWIQHFDSLVSTNVYTIAVDSKGNIWAGLELYSDSADLIGLMKYNGKHWQSFSVKGLIRKERSVYSITVDAQDNIWIGTGGGVMKYDGLSFIQYSTPVITNGAYEKYMIIQNPMFETKLDTVTTCRVSSLTTDALGNIYAGIDAPYQRISKFDGISWKCSEVNKNIFPERWPTSRDIEVDENNVVWTLGKIQGKSGIENSLLQYTDGNYSDKYYFDGFYEKEPDLYDMAIDADNNIWIGTYNSGLYKFDGANWTRYADDYGFTKDCIFKIAIDANGNKWLVSRYEGICKFSDGGAGPANKISKPNSFGSEIGLAYPNPASDIITLEFAKLLSGTDNMLYVYNLQGHQIVKQQISKRITKLDIRSFPKGIYTVKAVTGEGTMTKRVVKL